MYIVKKLPNGVISKCTKALNAKYGKPLVNCDNMWREWWKKDYNVKASVGWTEFIFESEQAYILFVLRWS